MESNLFNLREKLQKTEKGRIETGNEPTPSATTWPQCVNPLPSTPLLFPSNHHHPSFTFYSTFFDSSRAFSTFATYLIHLLISCHHSYSQNERRQSILKKKSCENMAGARGCFNCGGCAWCFCVVAVVVSLSRALCADPCTYSSPSFLPFFSCRRPWCGADGDRDFLFFFFLQIAIHRPGTIKIVIENPCRVHRNRSWCQNHQLDTRLRTAQRRVHPHGKKKHPFCSDQMTPSRESLTRAFLSCATPLISYNCESAVFSFSSPPRSRVGFGIVDRLSCTRRWYRRHGRSRIA